MDGILAPVHVQCAPQLAGQPQNVFFFLSIAYCMDHTDGLISWPHADGDGD